MAFELQAAKTKQRIMEEQMQVKVVERSQEIAVQEQEMLRRERELDATVRRPADAEKYRYFVYFTYIGVGITLRDDFQRLRLLFSPYVSTCPAGQ